MPADLETARILQAVFVNELAVAATNNDLPLLRLVTPIKICTLAYIDERDETELMLLQWIDSLKHQP